MDGRELAAHAAARGIDADLFVRLAHGGLRQRLARIGRAAGQADLAGVPAQAARAYGQRDRRAACSRVEQQQAGRDTRIIRKLAGLPARARRRRHEPHLCVEPRQRTHQPLAENRLENLYRGASHFTRRLEGSEDLRLLFATFDSFELSTDARSARSPTLRPYALT